MATESLALEELLQKGYRKLAQDRSRTSGLNYPAYRGEKLPPMSDLTQRARGLQEQYASKAVPYSNKISSVLSRPTGIGDDRRSGLLNNTRERQQAYGNSLLGTLQKEFRSSYEPRTEKFQRKNNAMMERGINEFKGKLGDINTLSGNLDQSSNQATAKALQGLSGQKQTRRNLLIDNLEQFGNQKHGLANLKNQADQNSFDSEVNAPDDKANKLEQVLNSISNGQRQSGGVHPDLEPSLVNQLQQAMSAYDMPNQPYPGQLVADTNAELETSQNLMGRLGSKFRDSFYPERKDLTTKLTGEDSVSSAALNNLPESIQGQIDQLEYAGKKRAKSDLRGLENKYVRLGQYGSPQHMKEAENRAKDINQSILEERNKITEGGLKNQLQMQHQENIGDIQQLGMLGDQGQQEFGQGVKNIRDLNKLGSTRWKNQQAENEDLYKNYQNESLWQWPHMRNQIRSAGVQSGRSGALEDVFAGMQDRNISLDNLAALNTNYSDIQRERDAYRDQAGTYRGELDNLKRINEEQTQRIAIARAVEQQRLVAEQNSQNQLRAQQAQDTEKRRLAELARQNQLKAQQAKAAKQERLAQYPYSIYDPSLATEKRRLAELDRQNQLRAQQAQDTEKRRLAELDRQNALREHLWWPNRDAILKAYMEAKASRRAK
jgi:hypothetical protein